MKDYSEFYAEMTAPLRARPGAVRVVKTVNTILTAAVYAVYPLMLLGLMAAGWRNGGLTGSVTYVLPYVLVPGVSFLLVTIIRDRINAPRPYESWPIDALIHKDTKGHSMPSRHVFSSAVISMCALDLNPAFGVIMLLISVFLAAVRVLGGVHYPKDVIAGFVIGILAGSCLALF